MYDVLIIGAGVIGASVARAVSFYQLQTVVIEKHSDVCEETSKANSGIVHSGYDAKPGTLKAKYNQLGSEKMESFCQRYQVPYRRNGSLVLGFSEADLALLHQLKEQGEKNLVKGLQVLTRAEALQMEKNLSDSVYAALYAPTGAIVDPFELTIAQAEVACENSVDFRFNQEVQSIQKKNDYFIVQTQNQIYETKTIINCAGVFADDINNMVSNHLLKIIPRKGEYCLFDKEVGHYVDKTIFQLPTIYGKGVLVTPTAENNLLIGPTAYDIEDKHDNSTTAEGLKELLTKANKSVKNVPSSFVITAFSGLRAHEIKGDFIIGETEDVKGFYNAAGIESPGLTASIAIGDELAFQVSQALKAPKKNVYKDDRDPQIRFETASVETKKALIEANRDYGKIICRCEMVTLAEIKNSIHRPLGATNLDGVKRRTRAGSGRCQGGFCGPRILDILAHELNKDPREIAKFDTDALLLVGLDKDML